MSNMPESRDRIEANLYPVLPLRDIVVFPHMIVPLFVGREKSIKALEEVMGADKQILLATQKNAGDEDPDPDAIYEMGTVANVLQLLKLPDGTVETLLKPENKDQLTQILTCHVVGADAMSGAIKGMIDDDGGAHIVPTLGGCELNATYDGDKIMLEDEQGQTINVTIADVDQSNGVIHVVDTVILPAAE